MYFSFLKVALGSFYAFQLSDVLFLQNARGVCGSRVTCFSANSVVVVGSESLYCWVALLLWGQFLLLVLSAKF